MLQLVLLCIIYSNQQMGSSIAYNRHDIVGGEEESLAEGRDVEKPFVIVIDQGRGASERLVSRLIME